MHRRPAGRGKRAASRRVRGYVYIGLAHTLVCNMKRNAVTGTDTVMLRRVVCVYMCGRYISSKPCNVLIPLLLDTSKRTRKSLWDRFSAYTRGPSGGVWIGGGGEGGQRTRRRQNRTVSVGINIGTDCAERCAGPSMGHARARGEVRARFESRSRRRRVRAHLETGANGQRPGTTAVVRWRSGDALSF